MFGVDDLGLTLSILRVLMYLLYHLMVQYHPGVQMLVGDGAAGEGGGTRRGGRVDPAHIRAHIPETIPIGILIRFVRPACLPTGWPEFADCPFPSTTETQAQIRHRLRPSPSKTSVQKSCRSASATQRSPIEREGGDGGGGEGRSVGRAPRRSGANGVTEWTPVGPHGVRGEALALPRSRRPPSLRSRLPVAPTGPGGGR